MNKVKIFFVIPSLGGGGAERIVVLLLEYLNKEKYNLVLVTFESDKKYKIAGCDNLVIYGLNKKSKISNVMLPLLLSAIIKKEKPDIILSFMNYANLVSTVAKIISHTTTYLIHSDHNNLTELMKMGNYGTFRKIITRILYKFDDIRICVSKGVEHDICSNWSVKKRKCITIYNPVDYLYIQRFKVEPVNEPWFEEDIPIIIACGRFSAQKNYPLLLNAFTRLIEDVDARLVVLGDGEVKTDIINIIEENDIGHSVKLLGFVSNPFKYIAKSTVFVLTSDSEGFGNVLIEAMACGTPVVSTKCPSGPEEIINHMEDGILIPVGDVDKCTDAIRTLLIDEKLRQQFSEKGLEKSKQYDINKVVKNYESVFDFYNQQA